MDEKLTKAITDLLTHIIDKQNLLYGLQEANHDIVVGSLLDLEKEIKLLKNKIKKQEMNNNENN